MKLLPIFDYLNVIKAVPGIVTTLLHGNFGDLDKGENRTALINAADIALTHQVPAAALLPEGFRKQLIGQVLDGILAHAHAPGQNPA